VVFNTLKFRFCTDHDTLKTNFEELKKKEGDDEQEIQKLNTGFNNLQEDQALLNTKINS
jgi:hypothetical protein